MLLLIDGYAQHRHLLDKSAYKKMDVFKKIADYVASYGHAITYHECMAKMDNLLWRLKNMLLSN